MCIMPRWQSESTLAQQYLLSQHSLTHRYMIYKYLQVDTLSQECGQEMLMPCMWHLNLWVVPSQNTFKKNIGTMLPLE